ncbi:MAG: STAS domain-containing protein [Treponema sp.]|uniref:STAS domain-containing protein n=1 Tax=Treponema sp. TaxID=166 RepID=UPI001B462898|nr:STAS domain-containing protein [Treponema sp.]MBP3772158.1 STAS domain-containing protein [Treponema sp.]MBQ9280976.1 STAS domain-containing protein [Treponema sp.]
MTVTKTQSGTEATLSIEGRLDTITAPELEKEITAVSDASSLVIDFSRLDYISSAGLRVLLSAHKAYARKGGLTITNVNDTVLDIFDVTGFKDILNIK